MSERGLELDPEKTKIVREFQPPATKSKVRSFLGMVNYCSKFIDNYSLKTEHLRALLKDSAEFAWDQQKAFIEKDLKNILATPPLICFYQPELLTELIVDASPTGIGAILIHTN